jgi:hypothetical protein
MGAGKGSPAGFVVGRAIGIVVLLLCGVAASADPTLVAYGKKVEFRRNCVIRFPDFTLTFLQQRHVPSTMFPRGFVYYEFRAHSGEETVDVSWSEGTGEIAPVSFRIASAEFLLELKLSKATGWLKDGELVVRRAEVAQ